MDKHGAFRGVALLAAVAAAGLIGPTVAGAAAAKPSAPRALVVTAGPKAGAVSLMWAAPSSTGASRITSFGVTKSTDGGRSYSPIVYFGSTALTAQSTSFPFIACTTAKPGGPGCRYRVYARNASGNSAASNTVISWVTPSPPRAPIAAASDPSHVRLWWTAPSQAGGVALAYSVWSGSTRLGTTSSTSAVVPCTAPGATRCVYRIDAHDSGVLGFTSPSTTVSLATAPGATSGLAIANMTSDFGTGTAAIHLTWQAPTSGLPAVRYQYQGCAIAPGRKPTCALAAFGPTTAPPTTATPSAVVTCPLTSATCGYRVRAVNALGVAGPYATIYVPSLPQFSAQQVSANLPCTQTISAPASISSAASGIAPGGVLCLDAGTYTQAVSLGRSGTATAPITIESTPGQRAVLDGTGLGLGSSSSIVSMSGSYVHLTNVEVRNSSGRGISITGSNDIVANSTIHDMLYNGLVAAGSSNLIQGNEVYNTVMSNLNDAFGGGGWAEAMNTWQATNITFRSNYIHDNWGEGIDFIVSSGGVADRNIVVNNFSVLIYNDDSKYTTITNNQLQVTNSTYNRGSSRPIGIMMSEEGGSVGDTNIGITGNTISATLYGVAYWWAGSGALRSYSNVGILNNSISGTTSWAIHFDTVGSGSPTPFGNRLANNSISGSVSIGQPAAWTFT